MVAPVPTELAFTAPTGHKDGTVTGKVLSSNNTTAQPNCAAEAGVTLSLAWFDADGHALTVPGTLNRGGTPPTTTTTSQADGTFSVEWPASVGLGDQVTVTAQDATGNTSAPTSLLRLGTPPSPSSSTPGGSPFTGPGANGANPNDRLSSTGAAIAGIVATAILATGIGLALTRSKTRMC